MQSDATAGTKIPTLVLCSGLVLERKPEEIVGRKTLDRPDERPMEYPELKRKGLFGKAR